MFELVCLACVCAGGSAGGGSLATDTIEDITTAISGAGLNLTASLEDDGAGNKKLVLVSSNGYGKDSPSITIVSDSDTN